MCFKEVFNVSPGIIKIMDFVTWSLYANYIFPSFFFLTWFIKVTFEILSLSKAYGKAVQHYSSRNSRRR